MHLFIVWFLFFLFFSQPFSSFSSDFRFPHGKPKSNKFSPVEVPAAVPGLFLFFFFFLPHSSVFCIITFFSLSRRRIPTLVAINGGGCRRWENLRPLIPNFISFPPPFFSLFFVVLPTPSVSSYFPWTVRHILFSVGLSLSLFLSL